MKGSGKNYVKIFNSIHHTKEVILQINYTVRKV